MLTVAGDYPDTVFAGLTNEGSMRDTLDNTVNAFPNIFEGRYLEGVIALCGYVTASNGHQLAFSILVNGTLTAKEARDFQDRICQALAR